MIRNPSMPVMELRESFEERWTWMWSLLQKPHCLELTTRMDHGQGSYSIDSLNGK